MNRVIGLLPRGQVAAGIAAVGRGNLQIVIVIDVALRAGDRGVRIRQRETSHRMIERNGGPRSGVVALRAIRCGESRTRARVRRIVCLLPCSEVAASVAAVRGSDLQVVVVVDVALLARHVCVPGRQREVDRWRGVIPVESCTQPTIECFVAALAVTRIEIDGILSVRWVGRLLPVFQVA